MDWTEKGATGTGRPMANGGFELKKTVSSEAIRDQLPREPKVRWRRRYAFRYPKIEESSPPIDRSGYAWEKAYRRRTAAERVNSRLDCTFGLERHTIRGEQKMRVRCGLALCVMLAMAVGRSKANQAEKMRSLVA
jgi:hypothetical protein